MKVAWSRILVILMLLWVLGSGTYLAWHMSMTTDEGIHVASGYTALTRGDHRFDPEHPFLFKYLTALPLLIIHPNLPPGDQDLWNAAKPTLYDSWKEAREWTDRWFYKSGNNAKEMVFLMRLPAVLCLGALSFLMYFLGKKWFSERVGLWAMFFTAFNPTILAHGSTANNDVPVALAFMLALWALWAYWQRPHWRTALLSAVAMSAVFLTKFSGIAILPVALIWFLYTVIKRKIDWKTAVLHALVVLVGMWIIIWAMYFFRSPLTFSNPLYDPLLVLQQYLMAHGHSIEGVSRFLHYFLPSAFIKGMFLVTYSSSFGRTTYLLNHVYGTGVWYYFPVVFFLKTQIIALIIGAVGLGFGIRMLRKRWTPIGVLLVWSAVIVLFLVVHSKLNLGIRHMSVLLPLFSFGLALTIEEVQKLGLPIFVNYLVVALYAFPVIPYLPQNLLGFSNTIIWPPTTAYLYFDDSNLDWGQHAEQIAQVVKKNFPNEPVAAAYFWNPYALQYFGLTTTLLEPKSPPEKGIVIVTATQLARDPDYHAYRSVTPMYHIANDVFFYRASDLSH